MANFSHKEGFHTAWVSGYVDGEVAPPEPTPLTEAAFTQRVTQCLNKALGLDYGVNFSDVGAARKAMVQRLSELKECLRGVWFQPDAFLRRFRGHFAPPEPVLRLVSDSYHELAIGIASTVWDAVRRTPEAVVNLPAFLEGLRLACPDLADFHSRLNQESVKAQRAVPAAEPTDQDGGDASAWVPASRVWPEKFSSTKKLTNFRHKHPEMFRNPSKFKLEIHAGLWTDFWAKQAKAGFETLDGDLPSVADDPNVQEDAIAAAAQRVANLRAKKKQA